MNNKTRAAIYTFVFAAAILLFSCDVDGSSGGNSGKVVDFTSHNTDYSILVRNNTSERLVAFKGDLREDRIIGGIPARTQNHGLPNDPALFDKTEDFPMLLLTETQYDANKSNLNTLRNTPPLPVCMYFSIKPYRLRPIKGFAYRIKKRSAFEIIGFIKVVGSGGEMYDEIILKKEKWETLKKMNSKNKNIYGIASMDKECPEGKYRYTMGIEKDFGKLWENDPYKLIGEIGHSFNNAVGLHIDVFSENYDGHKMEFWMPIKEK